MFYLDGDFKIGTDSLNFKENIFSPQVIPGKTIIRDTHGRAQVAAPGAADDIARKAEVDAEAEAREAADALKAPLDSPVFTGTPKVPSKTSAAANDGTLIATEAQVYAHANLIAPHGEYPAGCVYEQYPDAPTPVEAGWPGTWEVWSSRAIIYGLRSTNSGSASIYIERQKCGNLLTASDLAIGAQVSSGAYAGYRAGGGNACREIHRHRRRK